MRAVAFGLLSLLVLTGSVISPSAQARPNTKLAESGNTQVVAKAAGREITISELRVEMARLGLSPNDPNAERIALDSVINRILLVSAARKADLHRRPEALAHMQAAQEKALADLYVGITSQPAEPSRQEIDDYIIDHPDLFARHRAYDFEVLSMPTSAFDEEKLTPLFDEEENFTQLRSYLDQNDIAFTINPTTQPSSAFPPEIRSQLAVYSATDNIVLKGAQQTQIMKIKAARLATSSSEDWPVQARQLLLNENSIKRAEGLITRLRQEGAVAYFRKSAAPEEFQGEKAATADVNGR